MKKKLKESAPTYIEDLDSELFDIDESLNEDAPTYIEDLGSDLFDIDEDLEEECEECNGDLCRDVNLTEDLDSSFPVRLMSEAEIRNAAKKVVKGAKVKFGFVKELKLDAKYAQGKFVKKDNMQYPIVKAIMVTESRGCTGVRYESTEGARRLHATQQYQDKLAARLANGEGTFVKNIHDSEAGLENILVTTSHGLKCVIVYPMSNRIAKCSYYISVNGEDWRQTNKNEIAQYMTDGEANKLLHPQVHTEYNAERQSQIRNNNGENTYVDSDLVVRDAVTGEKLKLSPEYKQYTYYNPNSRFAGIFQFDKETAIVPETPEITAEVDPLGQDFPEANN